MIFLVLVLVISIFGIAAGVSFPDYSDVLLLAVPVAIASIVLPLRRKRPPKVVQPGRRRRVRRRRQRPKVRHQLVLDGSNVMHWNDGTPQIETVREVLRHVTDLGYAPGVVFDANAGYLMFGRYRHDKFLSESLNLQENHVMVVPKGTPADPYILTAARDMGAQIITNDRYRDWADQFPEITNKDHLIKGGYRGGAVWLDLPPAPNDARR